MFFQHKASLLQPVMQHDSFSLNGTSFRCGTWLFVSLEGSAGPMRLRVDNVSIAPSDCGVALDHGRHAGGLVVVCCKEGSTEAGAMVSRHWLPADLDALFWNPAGSGPSCAIVDLSLAQPEEPLDGESAHCSSAYQVSSSATRRIRGVRADGVPTLVVRISLYADEFVCRERRQQSAGRVYMYYPGWCASARASSAAVRAILVTPAGVNSDKILEAVAVLTPR